MSISAQVPLKSGWDLYMETKHSDPTHSISNHKDITMFEEPQKAEEQCSNSTQGSKADSGKPRMDLISPLALAYLAKVLTFGAQKYEAHNWRKGIPMSKLLAASERHLTAIKAGIDFDSETDLPHAAHLMCECMFMIEQLSKTGDKTYDDRYHLPEHQKDLLVDLLAGEI